MSKVAYLLRSQRNALALASRAAVLPATMPFRRSERVLMVEMYEACWGSRRKGVYPEVELGRLMSRADEVRLLELPADMYNIADAKLLAVAALARRSRARVAFEIGTANGRTTRNLAANIDPDGRVYTISLPLDQDPLHASLQSDPIGSRFHDTPEAARITQLWGDSRTFDLGPYLGRCQFVFIDADNSDAAVTANSRSALELVDRQSGLIIWNDATRYGTQTALPRLMTQERLPVHLISESGVAVLCFWGGAAVPPTEWAERLGGAGPGPQAPDTRPSRLRGPNGTVY